MSSLHFFLMSTVDPKLQQIQYLSDRIRNLAGTLSSCDNMDHKWYSILQFVQFHNLITWKIDWQAQLVSYYCRLTEYEPNERQKKYYDELLKIIDQLVGLLND